MAYESNATKKARECDLTDEAFAELVASFASHDKEAAHVDMDDVLCELLERLGYGKTVAAFDAQDKWYA